MKMHELFIKGLHRPSRNLIRFTLFSTISLAIKVITRRAHRSKPLRNERRTVAEKTSTIRFQGTVGATTNALSK